MKEKKIVTALKRLNVYDLNRFSKYIHSPYFNVNKHISDYYDCLEDCLRNETIDAKSNQELWKAVFKDEPYHNMRFLKLNSDLADHLENFIAQQEYDNMTSLKACYKLAGAGKRNIPNLYNGILAEIKRLDKHDMNQSSEFYLNSYQIEKNIFSLKTENEKKNEKFEIDTEINIQNISLNLDIFYIAEKLRLYCTLLTWKKMYKLDIVINNMDAILNLATFHPYNEVVPIQMYYTMQMTYNDEGNTDHFFKLKELIKKNIYLFPIDEQKEIYATAISYCINKGNKNVSEFHGETFEIYKDALDRNVILENNLISPTDYRNIVPIALRVNEFDWTEHFIHDYAQYLDPRYRDNAVEFSLARLEFYRKNFGKVLDHLNNVTFDDVWYTLGTKTLQVAAYYELDEFDALESLLQSFKMYINREKSLTKERKQTYLNLIKYSSALMKINPKDKSKIMKLKDDIQHAKGVVSKPWLLEKVEALL